MREILNSRPHVCAAHVRRGSVVGSIRRTLCSLGCCRRQRSRRARVRGLLMTSASAMSIATSTPTLCLQQPVAVSSCVAFGPDSHLAAGSEDGSVRIYRLPLSRVVKAIHKLGSEVSSAAFASRRPDQVLDEIWVACGADVLSSALVVFGFY
jgi:WD40 repeat protein